MTRALVFSDHDFTAHRARFSDGDASAPLPYGIDILEGQGFTLAGVPQASHPWTVKLRDVVEHRLGFPLESALRGITQSGRPDVVIALLERQAATASYLKSARVPPYSNTALVNWSCWLADDIQRADTAERARLVRRYKSADLITHLSRHETEILVDAGFREEQLFPITYGVCHRYYTPPETPRDIDILAVGQDRGRDYKTLFDAVRGADLRVDVVCRPENVAGLSVPDNVRMHGVVPLGGYRDLLRRARIVAIPTGVHAYPTGSSVALESASSGCCVVTTSTPAMRDYFTDNDADDDTAVLLPPHDSSSWRECLLRLRDDEPTTKRLGDNARRSVESRFNADHMWTEFASELRARQLC